MADEEVGELKSGCGLHRHVVRLSKRNEFLGELRSVGLQHIAVQSAAGAACSALDGHLVVVHNKTHVDDGAAVAQDGVVLCERSSGLHIVPVDLEAHAVHARLEVAWQREGGRVEAVAVGLSLATAVLALEERVGHEVAVVGDVVAIGHHVKLAVVVAVEEHIAAHPRALVVERGGDGLSGLGREGLLQHRHVEHLGRLLTHLERLRLAVGLQGDAVEVAVGAIQLLRLLVVDVIIGGAESRCGRRAQLDVVDVEQEIARAVVGRLQVGHHEQFVKLGSGIAADGEHGVEPLVLAHLCDAGLPELLGHVALSGAVLALTHADEHEAACLGGVDLDVDILGREAERNGLVESHQGAEGVAAVARALCAEHLGRGVGCEAELLVDLRRGVLAHLGVALECAVAERRVLPRVVHAHLGVAVLAFEVADDMVVAGLCSCADGQEQRGQADVLFQIHGEWNKG